MACSKLASASYVEEMLTCSVCLELFTEPQTLSQCLHTYCAECVKQLMERQKNDTPGVVCHVCSGFTEEKHIRRNHFVDDLLCQHKATLQGHSQTRPKQCDQCPGEDAVVSWKCLDCHTLLCQTCKTAHLKIQFLKGHRLLELSEETESVIDELVFCSTHPDKPIELYCNKCEEAICITCLGINHNEHNIVTVQNALDRMVPDINQDLNQLDESLTTLDQGVVQLDVELEEVEKNFKQCSEAVDKEIEDRIERLRKEQQKLKAELAKEKQTQRALIEDRKNQLINKGKEITNIRNVTRTSLERARYTSLLNELVNGGLCRRLKEVTEEPRNPQNLRVKKATLKMNTRQSTTLEEEGLLGGIVYTTDKVLVIDGVKVPSGVEAAVSKYWPGSFTKFFKKPLKQTLQIVLPDCCPQVTICDDKLWAPIYRKDVVQIYTRDGKLVKSVKVEGKPTCVEKTLRGEMLVSCAESGLCVLSEDSGNTVKVASGSYTDVCVCGDSVYTWDWRNKQIVEFVKEGGDWRQKSLISVSCVEWKNLRDTLLVRRCSEDRAQLEFSVCSWDQSTVYQVNSQDKKVRWFGSEIEQGGRQLPRLCGVDSHGDILVAAQVHRKYTLLNPVSGSWKTVFTAENNVYNATMEGENTVWLSRYTGGQYIVTKHEVIL